MMSTRCGKPWLRETCKTIPVVDDGPKPLGVLDIRDAMKALFEQEEMQEQMLINYVSGIGYQ